MDFGRFIIICFIISICGNSGFVVGKKGLAGVAACDNPKKWGMHLTPEAPRSSIRALEDHSRTLGEFQERFAFRFQIQPLPSPRGAQ